MFFLLYFAGVPNSDTLKVSKTVIKYTKDPVAVFFGILSAFLIIVLLAFGFLYLSRKYKAKRSTLSVSYMYRQDEEDKVGFADKLEQVGGDANSNLTIENPLYAAEPAAVTPTVTFQENRTNPFTNDTDMN